MSAPIRPDARRERGFAMVALLVGMSVAAIWMTAALPAWRQQAQRQREEDLIFRGEQYARAIVLFQIKNRNANPPSIDALVSGKYLRKKWKDPITNQDFILIGNGISGGAQPGQGQQPGQSQAPGRAGQPTQFQPQGGGQNPGQQQQASAQMGITGVRSSSNATSIKLYNQQQVYSQWAFDAAMIRPRILGNIPGAPQQPNRQNPQGGQPGSGRPGGQPGAGAPGGVPGRGPQGGGPGTAPGRGPDIGPVPPGRAGGS